MRKIKKAFVQRLALCKRGVNGLKTLFKTKGNSFELQTLVKSAPSEKGELTVVIYAKGLADAEGDYAESSEAIESMTASLIANGGTMEINHFGDVLDKDRAYISEVFTIQETDERFKNWTDYEGNPVNVAGGAAAIIQLNDPDLRAAYRNGDWDGVSFFGHAVVEEVDVKAASQNVATRMGVKQEITNMTEAEIKALLAAHTTEVTAMVKSVVAEALTPKISDEEKAAALKAKEKAEAEAKNPAPEFKGDPLNADDLAEFEKDVRRHEIAKAITSGTMTADQIADMRKALTERQPTVDELKEAGIDAKEGESATVRALQVQLFKAKRGSNAPLMGKRQEDEDPAVEMAKANREAGLAIAKIVNAGGDNVSSTMRVVAG